MYKRISGIPYLTAAKVKSKSRWIVFTHFISLSWNFETVVHNYLIDKKGIWTKWDTDILLNFGL